MEPYTQMPLVIWHIPPVICQISLKMITQTKEQENQNYQEPHQNKEKTQEHQKKQEKKTRIFVYLKANKCLLVSWA